MTNFLLAFLCFTLWVIGFSMVANWKVTNAYLSHCVQPVEPERTLEFF